MTIIEAVNTLSGLKLGTCVDEYNKELNGVNSLISEKDGSFAYDIPTNIAESILICFETANTVAKNGPLDVIFQWLYKLRSSINEIKYKEKKTEKDVKDLEKLIIEQSKVVDIIESRLEELKGK